MYFKKLIFFSCTFFLILQSITHANDLHFFILEKILPNSPRIKAFEWHGKKYWLKKSTLHKFYYLEWLGREIGALTIPITFLKPTPYRTKSPLDIEKGRLLQCEQLNIKCPRLVEYDKDWLIATDEGVSAEDCIRRLPANQKYEFVLKLLRTILDNQKKGFYHGRYYLRDMLISSKGEISVFDFEENPLYIMNLEEAKAREIFHFIVSVSTVLNKAEMQKLGACLNKNLEKKTKKLLLIFKDYKKMLTFFDFIKPYLGRDFVRFLDATFFIIRNLDLCK